MDHSTTQTTVGPPTSHPDPTWAVRAELERVARSSEFSAFHEHHEVLAAAVLEHDSASLLKAEAAFAAEDMSLLAELRTARQRLLLRNIVVGALLGLWTLLCLLLAIVLAFVVLFPSSDLSRGQAALVMLVYLALALPGIWGLARLRRAPRVRSLEARRRELTAQQTVRRRTQTAEAYRRAVNAVMGAEDKLPFPIQAPDLVERSAQAIAPSRTIEQVHRFIESHSTSAVGLAGPRGSGKSTLIASLCASPGTLAIELLVSSSHERGDILRRMAFAVDAALRPTGSRSSAGEAGRVTPDRGRLVALTGSALIVGIALIGVDVLEPRWLARVGALGLAGVVLALAGAAATASLALPALGILRRETDLPLPHVNQTSAARLAARLVEDLVVEVSESHDTSAALSLGSVLGLERVQGRSRTRRVLGPVDLIDRLRAVLLELGEERRASGERVVVVVDELDKLPDVESLVGVVNGLKDLFRIPGVHFLVSVSHEALTSFELRGLQPRDAFDSSFDTVISMSRVTSDQALEILRSRVTGFPEPLGRVCHVWAGGLPRDLIRAARECVEIYAELQRPEPWPEVARRFLHLDLHRRVEAIRSQGWIVNSEPLELAERDIARGEPQHLASNISRPTALFACCALTESCCRALRSLESDPAPGGYQLAELDNLAHRVAELSQRPLRGIARLDQDEVAAQQRTS